MKKLWVGAIALVLVIALGLTGCGGPDAATVQAFNTAKEKVTQLNSTLKNAASKAANVLQKTPQSSVLDPNTLTDLQQTLSSVSTETVTVPAIAKDTATIKKQTAQLNKDSSDLQSRIDKLNTATKEVNDSETALQNRKQQEEEAKTLEAVSPKNTYSLEYTDPSGYKIKVTMRIGSWIKASNYGLLEKAWQAVGGKGAAPSNLDIGDGVDPGYVATDNGQGMSTNTSDKIAGSSQAMNSDGHTAIVYGTVSFENLTSGFDFSQQNPYPTSCSFSYSSSDARIAYQDTNGGLDYSADFSFSTQMTSNTSDPIPFAVAISGLFPNPTPNNPNPTNSSLDGGTFTMGSGTSSKSFQIEKTW